MTWVNKINQVIPKQPRSKQTKENKWWSDQEAAAVNFNWTNFSPAGGLANYDIKIKDSLLNKDKFEKYWSEKKINNFYNADVDGDGIQDLIAIDKDGEEYEHIYNFFKTNINKLVHINTSNNHTLNIVVETFVHNNEVESEIATYNFYDI